MFDKVKENLEKVIEIADSCPENYRVKCFEVLLEALVRGEPEKAVAYSDQAVSAKSKAPFFAQHDIQDELWQKLFNFDGSNYELIINDLKERTVAKKQIKLALILGVKNLLESNEPFIAKNSLVELCKQYSCYDSKNFKTYMKKNKNWFLNKANGWNLTIPGQKEAANVIKELV